MGDVHAANLRLLCVEVQNPASYLFLVLVADCQCACVPQPGQQAQALITSHLLAKESENVMVISNNRTTLWL